MFALLKKDWRLYRVAVIGGIVIVFMPYVFLGVVLFINNVEYGMPPNLYDAIYHIANVALTMTGLTAAIFGGMAFAQERRERWAEYLAMLPVRRHQIVISKIVLSLAFVGLLWLINATIVLATAVDFSRAETIDLLLILLSATAAMMAFSVAWLASTFLSSPAISVGIAAVATIACLGWPTFFPVQIQKMGDAQLASMLIACTLGMGGICLIAGTIHFMRRVEP